MKSFLRQYLVVITVGVVASLVGGILGFGGFLFLGDKTAESLRQAAWLPDSFKGALPKSPAPLVQREIIREPSEPEVAGRSQTEVRSPPLDEETLTRQVVEKVSPSVVSITISRDVSTRTVELRLLQG